MAFIHSSSADNVRRTRGFEKRSPLVFQSIGEVATELRVAQHVLRFWQSKFRQIRPTQRGGGRRYYRPEDVDLLRRIRSLLYDDGYTIRGVQRLLKEGSYRPQAAANVALMRPAARFGGGKRRDVENVLDDLQDALELLRHAIHGQH